MIHNNQPVVFTGALGRIGRSIVSQLRDAHPWRLVDLRADTVDGVPVHAVDILNFKQVLESFAGSRAIVHSAIADYRGAGEDAPEEVKAEYRRRMLEVNLKGTYNIYEAARILNISRVIFISSLTVALGPGGAETDCSVKAAPNPVNFYACTKLFGEQTGKVYQRLYGIQTHVLRIGQPFNPTGEHDTLVTRMLLNPRSASRLASFSDIARAVDASLKSPGPDYGIYNVVSHHSSGFTDHSEGEEIQFVPQDLIG